MCAGTDHWTSESLPGAARATGERPSTGKTAAGQRESNGEKKPMFLALVISFLCSKSLQLDQNLGQCKKKKEKSSGQLRESSMADFSNQASCNFEAILNHSSTHPKRAHKATSQPVKLVVFTVVSIYIKKCEISLLLYSLFLTHLTLYCIWFILFFFVVGLWQVQIWTTGTGQK